MKLRTSRASDISWPASAWVIFLPACAFISLMKASSLFFAALSFPELGEEITEFSFKSRQAVHSKLV